MNNFFYYFLLFLIFNISYSFADLKVEEWKQVNVFNELGQEIEVTAKLKAVKLNKNYYHSYWGFVFDKKTRINVLEAKVINSTRYKSTFGDNVLTVHFDKLFNNDTIIVYFKYQILNNEINNNIKYIRREWVQIPSFVAGAKADLSVKTLDYMDIYSTNYIFNKNYNIYNWSGIVDNNGLVELFEMTLKEATWKVSTNILIENKYSSLNNLQLTIPLNFIGGNNEIINYNVSSSQIDYIDNNIIKKNDKNITVNFIKHNSSTAFAKIEAIIKNNYNNFYWLNNFNLSDTLYIKNEYIEPYNSLINQIQLEDNSNLPTHIKIAKWVNKNIIYDLNYLGKKMSSLDILKTKHGVCEHYSILYQDLLRSIGIPAKTISGISYSFKKNKFENHAWVMVNYNSQWLPIDPTWGIYSGKLPISHIFLYNGIDNSIKYSTKEDIDNINLKIINNAEYIK